MAQCMCRDIYYLDKDPGFLDATCAKNGLTIREDNLPVARFSDDELSKAWKEWNDFGREDLKSRTLQVRPITTIDLSKQRIPIDLSMRVASLGRVVRAGREEMMGLEQEEGGVLEMKNERGISGV